MEGKGGDGKEATNPTARPGGLGMSAERLEQLKSNVAGSGTGAVPMSAERLEQLKSNLAASGSTGAGAVPMSAERLEQLKSNLAAGGSTGAVPMSAERLEQLKSNLAAGGSAGAAPMSAERLEQLKSSLAAGGTVGAGSPAERLAQLKSSLAAKGGAFSGAGGAAPMNADRLAQLKSSIAAQKSGTISAASGSAAAMSAERLAQLKSNLAEQRAAVARGGATSSTGVSPAAGVSGGAAEPSPASRSGISFHTPVSTPGTTVAGSGTAPTSIQSRTAATTIPKSGEMGLRNNNMFSFFLEKQAIVLDFGAAYTKIGFAAEASPRHFVETPELDFHSKRSPHVSSSRTAAEWGDILDKLLQKLFFHYLNVSPKDRRVVVCESVYTPQPFRNALAFILFKRFQVPSMSFVIGLTTPLYLTGLSSGIVIDLGYTSTRVLATCAGVSILSAYRSASPGGQKISKRFVSEVKSAAKDPSVVSKYITSEKAGEDLFAQICYVSVSLPEGVGSKGQLLSQNGVTVSTPKGETFEVPAELRWKTCEDYFVHREGNVDPEIDDITMCATVTDAFVEMIESCPVDVRGIVLQNVVLTGGCASLRGMFPRLALEFEKALRERPNTAALADRLRFTPLDFSPIAAVWLGGAIYASLESVGSITAADFDGGVPLPDWATDGMA